MFMIHIQKEVQLADSNDILFQEDLDRGGDLYKWRTLQHNWLAGCEECVTF